MLLFFFLSPNPSLCLSLSFAWLSLSLTIGCITFIFSLEAFKIGSTYVTKCCRYRFQRRPRTQPRHWWRKHNSHRRVTSSSSKQALCLVLSFLLSPLFLSSFSLSVSLFSLSLSPFLSLFLSIFIFVSCHLLQVASTCQFFSAKMLRDLLTYDEEKRQVQQVIHDLVSSIPFFFHISYIYDGVILCQKKSENKSSFIQHFRWSATSSTATLLQIFQPKFCSAIHRFPSRSLTFSLFLSLSLS